MTTFESFNLQEYLLEAIQNIGFKEPTEVQTQLIPLVTERKNLVGESQTGTGKTHTFLLPLFNRLNPNSSDVQVVITTPSRELAEQIYRAALQLASFSPEEIRVGCFVGGTNKQRQMDKVKKQQPHVVVGTPGRVLDLMKEEALNLHTANAFVIDEADMTLDMGFLTDVDKIAAALPKDVQFLIFSATIPEKLKPFLKKYMENPTIIHVQTELVIADTIDNWLISTKGKSSNELTYQLLTIGEPYLALVFANTKQRVDELSAYLKNQGLKVATIHGDIPARERKRVMKQVQNLDYQYVVATDLAARGIDIEGVSLVINVEIPEDLDFFIHRVGRTGRNGLEGTAITLYHPEDEAAIVALEKMGVKFEPKIIQDGEIVDSYDRNRRATRTRKKQEIAPELKSMVHGKKKVKPGYKKKMKIAIAENQKQKRKIAKRIETRAARKQKKNSYSSK